MIVFSRYKIIVAALLAIAGIVLLDACKKDEAPKNPYDDVDYGNTNPPPDTIDPFTITGLHRNIFSQKCAQPGCHDGNFEPDFRTVQSTYLSLVYHPLVKTDSTNFFVYRVKPYDTTHSWLHERLVTDNQVLGRMPLYADPLNPTEMNQINTWIMNGARNQNGTLPSLPNEEPTIVGYVCLNMSNGVVDTNRIDDIFYNPFVLQQNTDYQLIFQVTDDSTALNQLTNCRVRFNTLMDGFPGGATAYQAYFLSIGQYQVFRVAFNTSNFTVNDTTYFRFYCNDGDHQTDTEFPRTSLVAPYKTYYSFVVQ